MRGTLETQLSLEQEMITAGIERYRKDLDKAIANPHQIILMKWMEKTGVIRMQLRTQRRVLTRVPANREEELTVPVMHRTRCTNTLVEDLVSH